MKLPWGLQWSEPLLGEEEGGPAGRIWFQQLDNTTQSFLIFLSFFLLFTFTFHNKQIWFQQLDNTTQSFLLLLLSKLVCLKARFPPPALFMHPFLHSGFANLLSSKSFFLLFTFTFHKKNTPCWEDLVSPVRQQNKTIWQVFWKQFPILILWQTFLPVSKISYKSEHRVLFPAGKLSHILGQFSQTVGPFIGGRKAIYRLHWWQVALVASLIWPHSGTLLATLAFHATPLIVVASDWYPIPPNPKAFFIVYPLS